MINCFSSGLSEVKHAACAKAEKQTGIIAQWWVKMYPAVKALKVGYISPQNLLSLPSLMRLGLMIAFSCTALLGRRNRNLHIFSLLKPILAELRKLSQTHMHQRYGSEQQNRAFFFFFQSRADGGGKECQHLC